MPVSGTPAFNAVVLLEIEKISFISKDVRLVGHGAFVNMNNGKTYGHTTCSAWSKHTLEQLEALRAAMEEDLAAMVFEDHTPSGGAVSHDPDPGGLGELLSKREEHEVQQL